MTLQETYSSLLQSLVEMAAYDGPFDLSGWQIAYYDSSFTIRAGHRQFKLQRHNKAKFASEYSWVVDANNRKPTDDEFVEIYLRLVR